MPMAAPPGEPAGGAETVRASRRALPLAPPDTDAPRVVVVSGAPGTGKSALLTAMVDRMPSALVATCTEGRSATDFAAARQLLPARERAGARSASPDRGHRMVLELYRRTSGLLQYGPLLFAIDDAHWCDEATLRWLHYLLRRIGDRPLQVVLAVQPREHPLLSSVFHEILGSCPHQVVDLDLAEREDRAACTDQLRRLFRHQPNLQRVAVATALLRRTDADLVGPLAGLAPQLVGPPLAELRRMGLLTGDERQPVPPVVADRLLRLHGHAEVQALRTHAARLLSDAAAPTGRIAELLLDVDDLGEPWMLDLLRDAAGEAYRRSAGEAVRLRARILQAAPQAPEAAIDLAEALLNVDAATARAQVRQALPRMLDGRVKARALVCLGLAALVTGHEPTAPYLLQDALETLKRSAGDPPKVRDRALLAAIESTLAANAVVGGATYHTVRSRIGAEPGPVVGTSSAHRMLAVHALTTAYEGTDTGRAVRYARQVLDRPVHGEGWPRLVAARVLFLADDTARAVETAEELARHHRDRGEPCAEAVAWAGRAHVLWETGDLAGAERDATTALRLADGHDWAATTWSANATLAVVQAARAQVLGATSVMDGLCERAAEMPFWEQVQVLNAAATTAYWAYDHDRALDLMQTCGRVVEEAGACNPALSSWWLDEIILLQRRDRAHEAQLRIEQVEEQCRRWSTPRTRGMALLARAAITPSNAQVELLVAALAEFAGSPAPLHQVKAQLMLGRALTALGDRTAARRHLRDGMVLSNRLGYTMLAVHCRNVLTAAGGRTGSQLSACGDLSNSAVAVAQIAAAGATNRQIAAELFITVRTVEFHLTNVYRRLGIRRRDALADVVEPMPLSGRDRDGGNSGEDR
ncbi:AAA family ATPase [Dactylosporangium fulvum]|uniref:AAA family ATPase n=1 Tax=Dactylosporangium fulvum TaxID=53359 RepID=UPI0031D9543F